MRTLGLIGFLGLWVLGGLGCHYDHARHPVAPEHHGEHNGGH